MDPEQARGEVRKLQTMDGSVPNDAALTVMQGGIESRRLQGGATTTSIIPDAVGMNGRDVIEGLMKACVCPGLSWMTHNPHVKSKLPLSH